MSMSYAIAQEGIFDPEATVETLLEAVKENITSKVTSVDQAADLENRLSEEAAEFNAMLSTISNAMRQCEAGEITKEEALAAAKPCVDALKERCEALRLGDIDVRDDDITENEIAMLREYIVGCKDIVAAHKEELQDCPITQNDENSEEASEGVLSYLGNLEVAEEASGKLTRSVRHSIDAKNAAALYKNAKKLYAMGSKDKAKSYMEQAKAKYQKCLDDAKKVGKEKTITRTTMQNKVYSKKLTIHKNSYRQSGVIDTDSKYKVYETEGIAHVIAYFEDRVDTCEAYLRQWANKAGNRDLQETKEMLKRERQEEKARIRAERKAAKEKAAAESAIIAEEIAALESMMDGYELDLALDAAMEAEGSDAPASKASAIGSKLRAAFGKLKDAFKRGDKKAADSANAEVKAAASELNSAETSSNDEGKKKLSTAAKIGIAAAAAAVLFVGDVALGQVLRNKAKDSGNLADLKGLTSLIVRSSDAVVSKVAKVAQSINKSQLHAAAKAVGKAGKDASAKTLERYQKAGDRYKKTSALLKDIKETENIMKNAAANRKNMSPSAIKQLLNRVKMTFGKMNLADSKIKELNNQIEALKAKVDKADDPSVIWSEIGKLQGELNRLEHGIEPSSGFKPTEYTGTPNYHPRSKFREQRLDAEADAAEREDQAAWGGMTDSYIGADFLASLAMEEANFGDDVALTEIENEEGRGFDDEAQGEDLIDEAIVGEDEFDDVDEEEADESVLESALAIFKLEDGLDPDED